MGQTERRALVKSTAGYVRKCIAAKLEGIRARADEDGATIRNLTVEVKELRAQLDSCNNEPPRIQNMRKRWNANSRAGEQFLRRRRRAGGRETSTAGNFKGLEIEGKSK
jgi:hypothetical protein